MLTQLVCPNCEHQFTKVLAGFNRTATCPGCGIESYMLLEIEPVEICPANWTVSRRTEFDIIYADPALDIKYTVKEIWT